MEKFIYETPQTEVVEIFAEGILCESDPNSESEDYIGGGNI